MGEHGFEITLFLFTIVLGGLSFLGSRELTQIDENTEAMWSKLNDLADLAHSIDKRLTVLESQARRH